MSAKALENCRRKVKEIAAILAEKKRTAEVVEYFVTIKFVNDVLEEYAKKKPKNTDVERNLVAALSLLNEYAAIVEELVREKRLARFLNSNRVRKKLDVINSNLHREVSHIFVALRTGKNALSSNSKRDSNDIIEAYNKALDAEGRAFWEERFGENPMVPFDVFLEHLTSKLQQAVDVPALRYLLDNTGTGTVSLYKFSEFLKGFGPLSETPRRVAEVIGADWFHGFLSSDEAARLLEGQPPFTFLVRISKSKPGAFAAAYVSPDNTIVHALFAHAPPNGFTADERTNKEAKGRYFTSLTDVLKFYDYVLKTPYRVTLSKEPWFYGDVSSTEAADLLTGKPNGTFLFRFSSVKGCLAVSYVENGQVAHGKVELTDFGYRFENEEGDYMNLQELVNDYRVLLATPLESNSLSGVLNARGRPGGASAANGGGAYMKAPQKPAGGPAGAVGQTHYDALPERNMNASNGSIPEHLKGEYGSIPNSPNPYGSMPSKGQYGSTPQKSSNPYGSTPVAANPYGSTPQAGGGYGALPGSELKGPGYGQVPQQQ